MLGLQPAIFAEIAARFGVTGAHQHAAIDGLQRKDVTGLHQIARLGHLRGHGSLHRAGAVSGRDAGGDALGGFDGDGEGGGERGPLRAVIWRSCRRSQRSRVSVRQIRPRPKRAMKLMASGVTWSAASTRSPSFSRSSSSTRMTMRPARISATMSSTGEMATGARLAHAVSLRVTDSSGPNMRST
jgi:hypothetical protein